ncbi:putative transmembrane protein [Gregarina niphandrodes]|uniref:Transmembrane protein n=1 Tax=Gregarina niphandrodes TaxID=110365 RepID=A0A023B445_GRENI|nr:putative transmembrane protein [Gregarina niphandrodes]EZG56155.1 putative transmembrane protein [Gregarina niphandrodes]|eukprot:XP_011131328.1 putative transmembrane protein [Gregarina niphandrodes]
MTRQQPPRWAIATATLCPCVAAVMLFFGLYGGMACALLSSMAIVLGSSWRVAALPAVLVALYGVYESAWMLRELFPWNEPYEDWTSRETYTTVALAGVLGVLSVMLGLAAMIAAVRAPIYKQRGSPRRKRNSTTSDSTASPSSPQQQIIVTQYQPNNESPRLSSPRLSSPRLTPTRKPEQPRLSTTAVQPTTNSVAAAAATAANANATRHPAQLQAPVTVVQRTPSGTIYTNSGVILPSGEVYTEIRSTKTQAGVAPAHPAITYAVPAPAPTPVLAPMQAQAPLQMPMQTAPMQQHMMQPQQPPVQPQQPPVQPQQPPMQPQVHVMPQQQAPMMQAPMPQAPVMHPTPVMQPTPVQPAGAHVHVTVTPQ